jgi:hypothetical protein
VFNINLSLGDIRALNERLKAKADVLLERAVADLAAQTHAKLVELAASGLRTSRQTYIDALSYEETGRGAWTVTLDKNALWIEDGMPRHEMIDDLIRNNPRISNKTGARYKIIPFSIKGPSATAVAAMPIRQAAMKALRQAGINMKEVEKEVDGRVKQGTLHRLNVVSHPLKTAQGPHQGHGPMGSARQGMSGMPFLSGLTVQQRRSMTGMMQKTAMTFRVVSSFHKGSGKWVHPGVKAHRFMDQAAKWAHDEWENKIKPEIFEALQPPGQV